MHISSVVAELKKKYSLEVEIIKKTEVGLLKRIGMPKFPAVEIGGNIISEGRDITVEELEREIRKRNSGSA
jgi:hypothetical protein